MNNAQQTARVGLFFLLGVALVWVTYETLSGGHLFKPRGYTLVASFDDLQELKQGDDVRMAGVKIGAVDQTRLADGHAVAVLRIDPGYKVPNDATATIIMAGIIGTDYIGIDMGTPGAPPLADGAEIRTTVTPNINSIMKELGSLGQKLGGSLDSFSSAMSGSGGQQGLIQKLDSLVTENRANINQTLANLKDITSKIDNGQGTVGKLINDSTLHDQLVSAVGDLKAAAAQAKTVMSGAQDIMNQVKSGQGVVGTLVYDQKTADNLKATVQNIREVSDKIASGQGTLGKLINDESLYLGAQATLKKADRTLDGMNDSGSITAVGILANSLF